MLLLCSPNLKVSKVKLWLVVSVPLPSGGGSTELQAIVLRSNKRKERIVLVSIAVTFLFNTRLKNITLESNCLGINKWMFDSYLGLEDKLRSFLQMVFFERVLNIL